MVITLIPINTIHLPIRLPVRSIPEYDQEFGIFYLALLTLKTKMANICDRELRKSYIMGCPPVRGDNPRALASGLYYVQVDNHGITILYHQHKCRPCTSRAKDGNGGIKF